MPSAIQNLLSGLRVVDGGMASELEYLGADLSGPLWSAHVLEDSPEKIIAVHRAYIEAGAEVILSASYQVSRMGYAEYGLSPGRADRALLRAVSLAQQARAEHPSRRILVAASLGPYGAARHDGSEYHGDYSCSYEDLVRFHSERIGVLAANNANSDNSDREHADLLAFETLPSLLEAQAVAEALAPFPHLRAWFCFTCCDALHVAHGERLHVCAAVLESLPQTVAIGVNCTQPRWIEGLIGELRSSTVKPIVVYPNSGEDWDATRRVWTGNGAPEAFGQLARRWYAAGAQIVGGCCRTRPHHIQQVAQSARSERTL